MTLNFLYKNLFLQNVFLMKLKNLQKKEKIIFYYDSYKLSKSFKIKLFQIS